jgi:hypothetical protein
MSGTFVSIDGTLFEESSGDTAYSRLFADARSRALVRCLADHEAPIELDELARAVAAAEKDEEALDRETYERVLVSLHESHLPVLAESDLAEVERQEGIYVCPNDEALAAL